MGAMAQAGRSSVAPCDHRHRSEVERSYAARDPGRGCAPCRGPGGGDRNPAPAHSRRSSGRSPSSTAPRSSRAPSASPSQFVRRAPPSSSTSRRTARFSSPHPGSCGTTSPPNAPEAARDWDPAGEDGVARRARCRCGRRSSGRGCGPRGRASRTTRPATTRRRRTRLRRACPTPTRWSGTRPSLPT